MILYKFTENVVYQFFRPKTMITEIHTHRCGKCGSHDISLNGHNRCGNQQYLRNDCGTCRVLKPKQRAYSPERQEEILRIYQERSSVRGVERATDVSRHTLASWIKKSRSFAQYRRDAVSGRAGRCLGTGRSVVIGLSPQR